MLLYGCGLRISEALNLTAAELPLSEWLRIKGKGSKYRDVPVLKAVADAVHKAAATCPFSHRTSNYYGALAEAGL